MHNMYMCTYYVCVWKRVYTCRLGGTCAAALYRNRSCTEKSRSEVVVKLAWHILCTWTSIVVREKRVVLPVSVCVLECSGDYNNNSEEQGASTVCLDSIVAVGKEVVQRDDDNHDNYNNNNYNINHYGSNNYINNNINNNNNNNN
jgi:hypothetical protein